MTPLFRSVATRHHRSWFCYMGLHRFVTHSMLGHQMRSCRRCPLVEESRAVGGPEGFKFKWRPVGQKDPLDP